MTIPFGSAAPRNGAGPDTFLDADDRSVIVIRPFVLALLAFAGLPALASWPPDPLCTTGIRGGLAALTAELENPLSDSLAQKVREHNLQVSEATERDLDELSSFIKKQRSSTNYDPGDVPLDEDLANLHASYRSNNGQLLVIRNREGKIVGTGGIYKLNDKAVEVRKMYLDSELRGTGLGSTLLDHLLEEASFRGYTFVELETLGRMNAAKALYAKKGFKRFYPDRIEAEENAAVDVEAYYKEIVPKPRPPRERTRGATRGMAARSLVDDLEDKAQVEYGVKYGTEVSPAFAKEIEENPKFGAQVFESYLKEDFIKNPSKRKAYEKLGIRMGDDGRIQFSDHGGFVQAYRKAMDELGIPEDKRMYPAVMYGRYVGEGKFEYTTVVPGVTPFPRKRGFELVGRAPDEEFVKALQRGHMILSNFHDVHHALVNLIYPHFGPLMVEAFQRFPLGKIPFLSNRRLNYAMESLTLVEPSRRAEVLSVLKTPAVHARTGQKIPFSDFSSHADGLSHAELLGHAGALEKRFDSLVDPYNGAMMSSTEGSLEVKNFRERYSGSKDAILDAFPEVQVRFTRSGGSTPELVPPGYARLQGYDSSLALPRESFLEDPMIFSTKLGLLREGLDRSLKESPRDLVRVTRYEKALRLQLSRMEYFLYTAAYHIPVKKWVEGMVTTGASAPEVQEFIRNSFGEGSVTYRMLFSGG
jgi:GNAT superfamily N-acetyltransferase